MAAACARSSPGARSCSSPPRSGTSPGTRRSTPRSARPSGQATSCWRRAPTSARTRCCSLSGSARPDACSRSSPIRRAAAGLRQHIALNAVADRVTPVAAAVADGRDAVLRLALGESSGISRLLQPNEAPVANSSEVRATSIDQFCAEHRLAPRVIKIDVEGAELAALRGARATIAAAGRDLQLFVEMHPHLWTELGIAADDVQRECEATGPCRRKAGRQSRGPLADRRRLPAAASRRSLPRRSLGEGGRMRIVVAHESVGTEGGVETYLQSVIRALGDRGHQVALLYHRRSEAATPLRSSAHLAVGVEERGMDAALDELRQWRPDAAFSHNMGPLDVDRQLLARWPVVKMLHGYFGTCVSGLKMHAFPAAQVCGRTFGPACLALYVPRRCGQLAPGAMVQGYRWASRQRELFPRYSGDHRCESSHARRDGSPRRA